jgi:lipopolysaccharide/colanic/teichoic acid biosynthesis glycosyltransferase
VGGTLHAVEGLPLLTVQPPRLSRAAAYTKRAIDVSLAAIGLVALSPLLLGIAVAIRATSSGPVLFRQVRVGHRGEVFRITKFRTMYRDAEQRKAEVAHLNRHVAPGGDPRMFKIPDDPRVTRVGRFLRRTSLDELPQLIDVLTGCMSLVGPRPLIPDEAAHVESWHRRRLDLRPGITGPWQVLGRSSIPFEEMVRLDYMYVTHWSLWEDVRLLVRTVPTILRGRHAE